jgi:molecular chaperone GrpE
MKKKAKKEKAHEEEKEQAADESAAGEKAPPGEPETAKEVIEEGEKELRGTAAEATEELKKKAAERDKFLDLLQRTRADYLNYQKRTMREMNALKTVVLCDYIRELLPVLDDFERAIESAEKSRDFEGLYEGVKLIDRKLREVLKKYEVEPIEVVGETFDPQFHEALLVEETEEYEDKAVIDEIQKGYKMPGMVLRPSRVKVAKRKEAKEEARAEELPQEEEAGEDAGKAKDTPDEKEGERGA